MSDPRLVAGAAAHYEDPSLYTRRYRRRVADVRYYVDLARDRGGPVLEYGCGNGRITLPLARAGLEVTAVDSSTPMTDDLHHRLSASTRAIQRRVRVLCADMRDARLEGRFPLVLAPFNTFLHLYERSDAERFLARVRDHLAPGGAFVFDASVPSPADLARNPDRPVRGRPVRHGGREYRYQERFEWDPIGQILFVEMEYLPADGSDGFSTLLAHRQYFPRELEALLHYNGFVVARCTADFGDEPEHAEADALVWECRSAVPR